MVDTKQYLFYLSVQHRDPAQPTAGPLKDGWTGRPRLVRIMTVAEAKAEAKKLLDATRGYDPTLGRFISANGLQHYKYRVRIRQVIEYNDTFLN
jgi:hypothetical protein